MPLLVAAAPLKLIEYRLFSRHCLPSPLLEVDSILRSPARLARYPFLSVRAWSESSLRSITMTISQLVKFIGAMSLVLQCAATSASAAFFQGVLQSGGTWVEIPLSKIEVTLYEATDAEPVIVAQGRTNGTGGFLMYVPNASSSSIYFAKADLGDGVELIAILGKTLPATVVINELTTVAASYSMAQFFRTGVISGDAKALRIAALMNDNLVDVTTGASSAVLLASPNADQTNSLRSTRSLANLLSACTVNHVIAGSLKKLTRPPGGALPTTTPQALANLARDPGRNVNPIYNLTTVWAPYLPAVSSTPDAWTITVKINDSGDDAYLIGGPGNLVFDENGYAWVTNNVVQGTLNSSQTLLVFQPNGMPADGTNGTPVSPILGGGLLGCGFGIARDPQGSIWVGNFGWGPVYSCTDYPSPTCTGSLSKFAPNGAAVSPATGFQGGPNRAQGLEADPSGNIWITSYGNYPNTDAGVKHQGDDTVFVFINGDPNHVASYYLYPGAQPFDVAIAADGTAWVTSGGGITGAYASSLARFQLVAGEVQMLSFVSFGSAIKGISIDSLGNVWVASQNDNKVYVVNPDGVVIGSYSGGGMQGPWSVTVDGDDNVWVANFGALAVAPYSSRLSKLAGANEKTRPFGLAMGDAISPATGYTVKTENDQVLLHDGTPLYGKNAPPSFEPLQRMTNTMVDSAGNLWCINNFKNDFVVDLAVNPGGDGIVIFVGLAAPTQPSKLFPPACMGDINGDGSVGPADLAALLSNWGAVNPAFPAADLNGDAIVNSQDLAILLSAWGPCLK